MPDPLLTRLQNHIAKMAPLQKVGTNGKLLIESAKEINVLQAQLRAVDTSLNLKLAPEILCSDETAKELMAIAKDKWVRKI